VSVFDTSHVLNHEWCEPRKFLNFVFHLSKDSFQLSPNEVTFSKKIRRSIKKCFDLANDIPFCSHVSDSFRCVSVTTYFLGSDPTHLFQRAMSWQDFTAAAASSQKHFDLRTNFPKMTLYDRPFLATILIPRRLDF
jgi:hypothetical protein